MISSEFKIDPKLKVGVVTLAANDIEMLSKYYQEIIGLTLIDKGGDEALLGVDDTPLIRLLSRSGGRQVKRATGLFHTAFLLPSRADLGQWLVHYAQTHGGRGPGAGDHLVSEAFYLDDPEGNGIEVYRDRPRSEWTTDGAGHIKMDTLPVDVEGVVNDAHQSRFEGLPSGSTIGHIHLKVSNIPEAVDFYAGLLGVTQTDRAEFSSAAFFGAGGYHHHIGSNVWHSSGASKPPAGSLGLQSFELTLSNRETLSALLDQIENHNRSIEPDGDRYKIVDPSGNLVILNAA